MTDQIRIEIIPDRQVDKALEAAIVRLQKRAFPESPRMHRNRHYRHIARPDDMRVLAWRGGDTLVGQTAVYQAMLSADTGQWPVACLGAVCSDPDARGQGAASGCLRRALEWARTDRAVWALLFCREQLGGFYGKFGFERYDNEVYLTRPDGQTYRRDWHDRRYKADLPERQWPDGPITLDIEDF